MNDTSPLTMSVRPRKFTFTLRDHAAKALEDLARREGISKASLVSRALALYEILAAARDQDSDPIKFEVTTKQGRERIVMPHGA